MQFLNTVSRAIVASLATSTTYAYVNGHLTTATSIEPTEPDALMSALSAALSLPTSVPISDMFQSMMADATTAGAIDDMYDPEFASKRGASVTNTYEPSGVDIDKIIPHVSPRSDNTQLTTPLFCSGEDLSKKDYAGVCMDGNFLMYSAKDCNKHCKCDDKNEMTCDIPSDCGPLKDVIKYCTNGPTFTCICMGSLGMVRADDPKIPTVTKKPFTESETATVHISFPPMNKRSDQLTGAHDVGEPLANGVATTFTTSVKSE